MKTRSPATPPESKYMHLQEEDATLIGLPRWLRDALAYKPEQPAVEPNTPAKPTAAEAADRRNIRILSRVL